VWHILWIGLRTQYAKPLVGEMAISG